MMTTMRNYPERRWRCVAPLVAGALLLGAEVLLHPAPLAEWVFYPIILTWVCISLVVLIKDDQNDKNSVASRLLALDAGVGVLLLAGGLFMVFGFSAAAVSIVSFLEKCSPLLAAWWAVVYRRQIQRVAVYLLLIFIGIIPVSSHLEGWPAIQFVLFILLEVLAVRYALAMLQPEMTGQAMLERGTDRTIDPVTGLALPETFEAELALISALADRQGTTFSLLACEIGGYSAYVDRFGTGAGERLLRQVALAVGDCVRISDTLGRWDGPKIMAVLPATAADGAQQVADKMRCRAAAVVSADRGPVALRFAVAQHRSGDDPLVAVEQVERALAAGSHADACPA